MGKKTAIIFGILLAVILGGGIWTLSGRLREPSYQGKGVTVYLDQMATNWPRMTQNPESVSAIYQMGTNTIPYLRHGLKLRKSTRQRSLEFLQAHLPAFIATWMPKPKSKPYLEGMDVAAATCLANLGPLAEEAIPDLIGGFDQPLSANMAVYAIGEIGPRPEDIPALLPFLMSTNFGAPIYTARLLGQISVATPEVLDGLQKAVQSNDSYVREAAIEALGALGPKAQSADALLSQEMSDSYVTVRLSALTALWRIEGKTNAPIEWLSKQFEAELTKATSPTATGPTEFDTTDINIMSFTSVFDALGTNAKPVTPLLREALKRPKPMLQVIIADTIMNISGDTNDFLPVCLRVVASKEEGSDRAYMADKLAQFCDKQHILPVEFENMLTTSEDPDVRFYAAVAIWKVKGETGRTLPALLAGLRDHTNYYSQKKIREDAANTLGEMGVAAKAAVPDLIEALHDPAPNVRAAAAKALKLIDPAAAGKAGVAK